jgi:phosphatidylserine synthase
MASTARRMFGIKDIFTTINVLGGVVAICLCIDGQPFAAGLAVMAGYVFGDTLDGWVARKLNSSNEFGAEYDTIADHNSHCIAPAAIVYTVYNDSALLADPLHNKILAMALASSIIIAATVRHARNVVRPVKFKGAWAGLPRTILGFFTLAYVNAALAPFGPGGLWLGVVLIPALSVSTLTYLPFANHHMARDHVWYVRFFIVLFFVTQFGILFVAPGFFFDVLLFWSIGYTTTAWMSMTAEERRDFRRAVKLAFQEPTS